MRLLIAGLCCLLPLSAIDAPDDVSHAFEGLDGLEALDGYRGENAQIELVDDCVEGEHAEIIFDALTVEATAVGEQQAPRIETDVDYEAAFARTQAAMDRAWPTQWGEVAARDGRIVLSGEGWSASRPLQGGELRLGGGPLRFMVRAGLDGEWHELPEPVQETVTDHAVVGAGQGVQMDGLDLRLVRKIEAHELGLVVTFAIVNNADAPADVALRVVAPLESLSPTELFDGLEVHADPQPGVGRATDLSTFPMACMSDGADGLALGLAGDSLNAFMESGIDEQGALFYGTRLHLAPAKKDVASFVVFPFRGDFGHLGAVERYYRLFPARFWPAPDVHPGLARGIEGCGHVNSYWRPGYSRERTRRMGITHDWFYAPWKRPGDMWGREELWDYEPGFPDAAARSPMFGQWRPADMHADRQQTIERTWDWGVATCWYIINSAEATLAQTIYADNMIQPLGRQGVKNHDTDYRTFAWGGLYGRVFSDDVRRACEIADTTGFGHDNLFGHFRYRGPHVDDTPGAAFDEDGPYALDGQAMALQFDYLHSFMVRDGACRAGVKANPGGEHDFFYGSMFSADNFMVEHKQLNAEADEAAHQRGRYWYEKLRRICGHKFIGLHTSARGDELGAEVAWRDYSRRDVERVYQARLRRDMAAGLAYGIALAPDWTLGCPEVLEFQCMMVDLEARGWWPVHGVRTEAPVLCARYGEGGDAAIAIVNTEVEPVQATVTFDGSWLLGEGAPIVARYDGSEIGQAVDGTGTTLQLDLGGRDWVVLEIRGAWTGEPARLRVSQGKMPSRIVAKVMRLDDGPYSLEPLAISEYDEGLLALHTRTNEHTIVYDSAVFRVGPNELASFPFVADGVPACQIVVPEGADQFERRAAGFVAEYFRWWYERAAPEEQAARKERGAEVAIPIVSAAEAGEGPRVFVRLGSTPPRVEIEGDRLTIAAPSGPALQELTDRVLAALDEVYPWYGSFHPLSTDRWYPPGYGLPEPTVEMCRELGLWATLLPDLRYEEGLE